MSLYTDVSEGNAASFLRVEGIESELTVCCVKTQKATIWFVSAALTFLIAATCHCHCPFELMCHMILYA